jgi:hypothetical protein
VGHPGLYRPTATQTFIYGVLTIPFLKLLSPITQEKKKGTQDFTDNKKKGKMEKLKIVMQSQFS